MARTTCEAIALTTGELVHRAESDDVCSPSFLDRTVAVLDSNPSAVLVSTAIRRMDVDGRVFGGRCQRRRDALLPGSVAFKKLLKRNFIAGPSTLFTRDAHDRVGGFGIPPYEISCDFHLSLRLAAVGDVAYISDRLYYSRLHGANLRGRLVRNLDLRDFEREGYELVRDAIRFAGHFRPELFQLDAQAVRWISLNSGASLINHVKRVGEKSRELEVMRVIESNDPGVTRSPAWRFALAREAATAACSREVAPLTSFLRR